MMEGGLIEEVKDRAGLEEYPMRWDIKVQGE